MSKYTPKELNLMYRVISTALKTVEDEVLMLIVIGVAYLYSVVKSYWILSISSYAFLN